MKAVRKAVSVYLTFQAGSGVSIQRVVSVSIPKFYSLPLVSHAVKCIVSNILQTLLFIVQGRCARRAPFNTL